MPLFLSQARRRSTNVFAGKQGFITLRDLFRWAERYSKTPDEPNGGFRDWDRHIAEDGKGRLNSYFQVMRPKSSLCIGPIAAVTVSTRNQSEI